MVGHVKCILVVLVVAVTCPCYDGARVLALFPTPSRSHIISYQALTRELASRGHELVVVSPFPQEKPLANYTDIVLRDLDHLTDDINLFEIKKVTLLRMLFTMGFQMCEFYLNQTVVLDLIADKEQHFDLILYAMSFSDCFLGFAHKYKVPVIGLFPQGGSNYILEIVGNPNPYSYIPSTYVSYSQDMSLSQRVVNTVSTLASYWARRLISVPPQDTVMRKHFSEYEPIPYVRELEREYIGLILLNAHCSISRNPRPYVPNVVDVGGMHITTGQKLPRDLQKFLDEAKHGVIYFSMGSNLKTSKMTPEVRQAFVTAFSQLKQRVLWKSDIDDLPGLTPNVKTGKWMPQISVLGHPNVKAFITHGGLLSGQEAIYQGVPVIGIPIFGDQDLNMHRAEEAGYGLLLAYKNISEASVLWAIDTVLEEDSYQNNAQKLSRLFRDQPSTPLEQAVYWTEYVLRHNGTRHMRSASLDLAWHQYFLLDVISVIALVALTLLWTLRAAFRALCRRVCAKKRATSSAEKSKKKVS